MQIDTIIFDLDGTLVDSLPGVTAALNKMLNHYGDRVLVPSEVKYWIGHGVDPLIKSSLSSMDVMVTGSVLEAAKRSYLNYYSEAPLEGTRLYPNVRETLDQLKNANLSMAICSNKPSMMVHKVLEGFNLKSYFPSITGGDCFPYKKPDVRHIDATLKQMQKGRENCMMVGDSESDILAAKNACIPSVLVSYGYSIDTTLFEQADYLIDDIAKLENLIGIKVC